MESLSQMPNVVVVETAVGNELQREETCSVAETNPALLLAAYSTAFQRLNFQDDYLFKINTLFTAVQGALVALSGGALVQWKPENKLQILATLAVTSILGYMVCAIWKAWVDHNDFWHAAHKGVLIDIERKHFPGTLKVFSADMEQMANDHPEKEFAQRKRGHQIGALLPEWLGYGWIVAFALTLLTVCFAYLMPLFRH